MLQLKAVPVSFCLPLIPRSESTPFAVKTSAINRLSYTITYDRA